MQAMKIVESSMNEIDELEKRKKNNVRKIYYKKACY